MLRKAVVLVVVVAAAGSARGDGGATTLFDSRPYVRDGSLQDNSLYESFSLSARGSIAGDVLQDVRIVARGWGRVTFGDPFDEHHTAGDVDSFFLEGKALNRHLLVRVGRQLATGGAVRALQFDGLALDGVVTRGFGAQAWVGIPVQPRFSQTTGDFVTGGRLFWRHGFDSEVGASYVYVLRRGYVGRNDLAADGSWTPLQAVTVSGLAQWSLEGGRLAEGRLSALWQVNPKLHVSADYQHTSPDLFVDRSSIFFVFSEEARNEVGGEAVFRPLPKVSLEADWHFLSVEGGNGNRGGARATYRFQSGTNYGAELRYLDQPDNGYTLARVFGVRKLPRNLTVTVDLDAYWLKNDINSTNHSFVGTLTGGWAFRPNWEAMLAGSLGATPYFERRTEVVARLVYKFGLPAGLPGGFR
jgi:hypothetical protein